MVAPPPPAGGIWVVEATSDADPRLKRSFAVVIERKKAAEATREHLGPGWSVRLTSLRLTTEKAGKLNFRQGEWGAIRELSEPS